MNDEKINEFLELYKKTQERMAFYQAKKTFISLSYDKKRLSVAFNKLQKVYRLLEDIKDLGLSAMIGTDVRKYKGECEQ